MLDAKLMLRGLALLVLLVLFFILNLAPTDSLAVESFQRGQSLSAQGRRTEAQSAYQEVIARRPLDPQPWLALGDLYLTWGQPEAARDAYAQALAHGAERTNLADQLAQAYVALGNDQAAIDEWRAYLAVRDNRDVRLALARAYMRLSAWVGAQTELEQMLSKWPDDAEAHAWLGLLLLGLDPIQAIPHLQFATADPAAASLVAPFLAAERRAVADEDPAYRLTLLGVAFLEVNEDSLARRVLVDAANLNPAYADAYAYLAQAFDRLGQPDRAQAALEYARTVNPQSLAALTLSGLFWDRRGESSLARDYYFAAYQHDRGNAALCLEIAETFVVEGNYLGAEIWLDQAISLSPDDPQIWGPVTQFYVGHRVDLSNKGVRSASQWALLAPDDPLAHDWLGWTLFLTGQETAAEGQFYTALELDPSLALAYYHLGRLYARQGCYAKAAEVYQRAADYDVGGALADLLDTAQSELIE